MFLAFFSSDHWKGLAMSDKTECTMPEDVAHEFAAIRSALCELHCVWRLYSELYGNPQYGELMDEADLGAFWLIHKALRHELLMGIGRLLDPAENGRFSNLSIEHLLNIIDPHCPAAFNTTLRKTFDLAKAHCAPLLEWRNKRVGHADREICLRIGTKKLPDVEKKCIESGLAMLLDCLKEVHTHFKGKDAEFHFPLRVGDAERLMSLIQDGLNARKAEIAQMFP